MDYIISSVLFFSLHYYNNIAYIKINSFSENADQEVIKHLSKLQHKIGAQKMIGLVLDLRNNPGGLLDQSVEISDLFLNKNQKIVSIKGKRIFFFFNKIF